MDEKKYAKSGEKANEKKAITNYVEEKLDKSLITGVSNLAQIKHPWRKLVKMLIVLICIIGFCYQTNEFVQHFIHYPTMMEVEITKPEKVFLPAITICGKLRITRVKFCEEFPDRCESPRDVDEYCKNREKLCQYIKHHLGSVKIPKKEFLKYNNTALNKDYGDLASLEKPRISHYFFNVDKGLMKSEKQIEEFNILNLNHYGEWSTCYTWNWKVNSTLYPIEIDLSEISMSGHLFSIIHYIRPAEYYLAAEMAEATFAIHSPFVAFDFLNAESNLMKPESLYNVYMHLEEKSTLPAPYSSNCFDYMEAWKADKTRARSQKICFEKCSVDTLLSTCNCSPTTTFYPVSETRCEKLRDCYDMTSAKFRHKEEICEANCRMECQKTDYVYSFNRIFMSSDHGFFFANSSIINIFIKKDVTQYRQRPKYEFVELFYILGGFGGFWLGVAFIHVADFLESLATVIMFKYRRSKKGTFPLTDSKEQITTVRGNLYSPFPK